MTNKADKDGKDFDFKCPLCKKNVKIFDHNLECYDKNHRYIIYFRDKTFELLHESLTINKELIHIFHRMNPDQTTSTIINFNSHNKIFNGYIIDFHNNRNTKNIIDEIKKIFLLC